MDDKPGFEAAVRWVIEWVQYNVDTKPQVFEVTIRALGGLLSGHIFASEGKFKLDWYRGELLALAKDLGERLLPAFDTPTGLPWARVCQSHFTLFTLPNYHSVDKPSSRCPTRRNDTNMWVGRVPDSAQLNHCSRYSRRRVPHPRVWHTKSTDWG